MSLPLENIRSQPPYPSFRLDEQIGFLLRRATQRHASVFSDLMIEGLTPTQFAALAKLYECGPLSQNHLGRLTAMDVATIKGVVGRLLKRGYVKVAKDLADRRRSKISLTNEGERVAAEGEFAGIEITDATLSRLSRGERDTLVSLLRKIV